MNTADEDAQMERDEWASREVMPITNWGRRPDGSEIVQYDAPMFFSFTEHSLLHQYPHMRAECHWHVDLELTYIIHGHMWYFVNGETVRLDEGQAIFVNSRQLHYGFTKDGSDCEFSCTLLNPAKMCASFEVYDRFIAPLMAENTMPYAVITDDTAPGRRLLATIRQLHAAKFGPLERSERSAEPLPADDMTLTNDTEALTVLSCFYAVVRDILAIAGSHCATSTAPHPRIVTLRKMIDYVQRYYVRPITLKQIASAGSVGRTTCASIFRESLNQSPIEFVNDVRVRAAANLLVTSSLPIATVAKQTGFSSASFFSRTFHRFMGVTPITYRTTHTKRKSEE